MDREERPIGWRCPIDLDLYFALIKITRFKNEQKCSLHQLHAAPDTLALFPDWVNNRTHVLQKSKICFVLNRLN